MRPPRASDPPAVAMLAVLERAAPRPLSLREIAERLGLERFDPRLLQAGLDVQVAERRLRRIGKNRYQWLAERLPRDRGGFVPDRGVRPRGDALRADRDRVDRRRVAPADPAVAAADETLPVYRYVQRDARFWGLEVETLWHLHDRPNWQLDFRLAADFTRAREGARDLPRIPAARTGVGLFWSTTAWSAGVESQFYSAQNRVAPYESPSARYALVSAHFSRTAEFGHLRTEVFVRGTNLSNAEARPHPSFVKDLAPLAGRGVVAGLRLSF